jgi:chromosome segregation ATPase
MMQRAPTPKNEKPAVTIANLERENDNLADRIDELSKRNIDLDRAVNEWRDEAKRADHELDRRQVNLDISRSSLEAAQAKIAKLESVLCGYRQAIADVHGHYVEIEK